MFGFTPHASRLGSISSRAAQVEAMGRQPTMGLQPPMVGDDQPPPPAPAGGAPGTPPQQNQGPVSQAYHWLTQQFGGAPAASAGAAAPTSGATAAAPDAVSTAMAGGGSGGSAEVMKYLASMFGL